MIHSNVSGAFCERDKVHPVALKTVSLNPQPSCECVRSSLNPSWEPIAGRSLERTAREAALGLRRANQGGDESRC